MSDLYPGVYMYQVISLRDGGYKIYNFTALQMLHTKFGKDRFHSSWEDISGQAIAMGHPSYSGDLKTEVNGFRVYCETGGPWGNSSN